MTQRNRTKRELYVSVDIEASGPMPPRYSMLAIGACVVGAPNKSFYAELRPISDDAVDGAMQIVGRPLSDFRALGGDPKTIMADFAGWLTSVAAGAVPVFLGFNATFDWAFVNWYFLTYLGENPFGVGGLDIKAYYMGLSGVPWADTRSSRIPNELKGDRQHVHNALSDSLEQAEMFERMVRSRGSAPGNRVKVNRKQTRHR